MYQNWQQIVDKLPKANTYDIIFCDQYGDQVEYIQSRQDVLPTLEEQGGYSKGGWIRQGNKLVPYLHWSGIIIKANGKTIKIPGYELPGKPKQPGEPEPDNNKATYKVTFVKNGSTITYNAQSKQAALKIAKEYHKDYKNDEIILETPDKKAFEISFKPESCCFDKKEKEKTKTINNVNEKPKIETVTLSHLPEEKYTIKRDIEKDKNDKKVENLLQRLNNWIIAHNKELKQREVSLSKEKNPLIKFGEALLVSAEGEGLGAVEFVEGTGKLISDLVHNPAKGAEDLIKGLTGLPRQIEEIGENLKAGNPLPLDEFAGNIATGAAVGEAIGASGVTEYIPKPAFAQIVSMGGDEAEPTVEPVRYGVSLVAKKPLLTIGKTDDGWTISLGAIPAPKDAIEGKVVTAFSPAETEFFKATLKEYAPDVAELFEKGYKIAKEIYKTKKPVTEPDELEILSSHIPEEAKAAVKDTIKSYKGDLEVYGSVAQKLQMEGWMSREPKDIEIKVDKPLKFIDNLKSKLDKAGIEYKIEEDEEKPKVYFKTKEGWEKGIEIFKSDANIFSKQSTYSAKYPIQYGFKDQSTIKVDNVDMMRLSEQAARKLAGGHVFDVSDEDIVPTHEGRWKDVNDLIEIGTAYAKGKELPIEEDVVDYAKLQKLMHPDKVTTPVADFILKEGRLPEPDEMADLLKDKIEEMGEEKELLFRKEKESSLPSLSKEDIGSLSSAVAEESLSSLVYAEGSTSSHSHSSSRSKSKPRTKIEKSLFSSAKQKSKIPSLLGGSQPSTSKPKSSKPAKSIPTLSKPSKSLPSLPSLSPKPSTPSKPTTSSKPSTSPSGSTPSKPTLLNPKGGSPPLTQNPKNPKKMKEAKRITKMKDISTGLGVEPEADWWALTYTQAMVGLKDNSPFRPDAKKQWLKDLNKYGFGLTFPTRFIEKHDIRSYLDTTIKKAGEFDITGKRAKKKVNRAKKLRIAGKDEFKVGFGSGKLKKVMGL